MLLKHPIKKISAEEREMETGKWTQTLNRTSLEEQVDKKTGFTSDKLQVVESRTVPLFLFIMCQLLVLDYLQ